MNIMPFNYFSGRTSFSAVREAIHQAFLHESHSVHTEEWQGLDISKRPEMKSHELMNVAFTHDLMGQEDLGHWRKDIAPNLPWADDHFLERVSGAPMNPGTEWANWPWAGSADGFRDDDGRFNHNYMERYWPKFSGIGQASKDADEWYAQGLPISEKSLKGIRNDYGDLDDLVASLAKRPLSRQEWFPIFYPEDVGEVIGGRKPCSLGYQFWVRGGRLHVYYPLRSCDFYRHMPDDIYLTVRLLLWVLEECRKLDPAWNDVVPGTYTMHCTSLHVFANDMIQMRAGQ